MRIIFGGLGILFFSLGTVGAFLPVVPTVPFLLLATFCFARSSRRLNDWFLNTKLYKNHLEKMRRKEMTLRDKCSVLISITLVLTVSFLFTSAVPAVRVILALVWLGHLWHFIFRIKTIPGKADCVLAEEECPGQSIGDDLQTCKYPAEKK